MKKKLLVEKKGEKFFVKDIVTYENPEKLKVLLNETRVKILKLISKNPKKPSDIARTLGIHEQKVYYHIRQLKNAGIVKLNEKGECEIEYPAFGIELPFGERKVPSISQRIDKLLESFFSPIIKNGIFNGLIVTGSPDPHGPYKAIARDSHYGIYLGMFLGQFCEFPNNFIIKTDVDINAEKEEKNNLILIGGPGTNLITAKINKYLPIHFNEKNYWISIENNGKVYTSDTCGIIAKIKNPFDENKKIIVLAGLKVVGTKACIIGITKFYKKILRKYKGEKNWACVIQGFDLDGDGKIDSIEVLE